MTKPIVADDWVEWGPYPWSNYNHCHTIVGTIISCKKSKVDNTETNTQTERSPSRKVPSEQVVHW